MDISRRDFLKKAGGGLVVTVAAPVLLKPGTSNQIAKGKAVKEAGEYSTALIEVDGSAYARKPIPNAYWSGDVLNGDDVTWHAPDGEFKGVYIYDEHFPGGPLAEVLFPQPIHSYGSNDVTVYWSPEGIITTVTVW